MHQTGSAASATALRARAAALALAWSDAAAVTTTLGRERAILRLLGVSGPAPSGRPLVLEVADRYFNPDPGRLARGIGLPFAARLAADGGAPLTLARAVADGSVDLGALPASLDDPAVRDAALRTAAELTAATLKRVDANRTARGELRTLLGEPRRPLLGGTVASATLQGVAIAANAATERGADLVVLAGVADPSEPESATMTVGARSVPGFAGLRSQLDEAGAVRGCYVRLGVAIDALGADQAVAAGLARADLALADPMAAIVAGIASPGHAIADHLLACRILARSGVDLLVPAGPLVVAPDLQSGVASSPATRSGRAMAIQLLAVALAEAAGIERQRITVVGLPSWLAEEPDGLRHAVAEVAARRILFAGHGFALVEPDGTPEQAAVWRALATLLLADGDFDMVLMRQDRRSDRLATIRGAMAVAAEARRSWTIGGLAAAAASYRDAMLEAAAREFEALEAGGWAAITGGPLEAAASEPRSGVARRTDGFDPLGEGPPSLGAQ